MIQCCSEKPESVEIPQINAAAGLLPVLSMSEAELVRAYYSSDLPL